MMGPETNVLLLPYSAVYVEIPKVACSSLKVALASLLELALDGPNDDPHQSTFPTARPDLTSPVWFAGYFAFAFVRNPWSRLLSCYRDKVLFQAEGYTNATIRTGVADCFARYSKIQPGMLFDDFVSVVAEIPDDDADAHFRSQHTFIANLDGHLAVDFVGRFERLEQDLRLVQQKTDMPSFALPRLQVTGTGTDYRAYYHEDTQRLVADRYAQDIATFGYSF